MKFSSINGRGIAMSLLFVILLSPFFSSAQSGAALNFDGTNDYVQMQEFNLGVHNFTVEAWIKPQPLPVSAYIVTNRTVEGGGNGNWWNLQLQATNIIGFEM